MFCIKLFGLTLLMRCKITTFSAHIQTCGYVMQHKSTIIEIKVRIQKLIISYLRILHYPKKVRI